MPDQIEQSLFNFESKDQLPKKKDRTLIKDLISYNWIYGNKRSKADFTVGNIYFSFTNIIVCKTLKEGRALRNIGKRKTYIK